MEYTQDVLDRTSGELTTKSIGNWLTVTELGEKHGVGPKKVRAILHHMGVLGLEGRHYRLLRELVEIGIGRRYEWTRSRYAFDVISPKGQDLIASIWDETVDDYDADCQKDREVPLIRAALETFKSARSGTMTTQEEVCWIEDHFRDKPHRTIAEILEVSPALVIRYAKKRAEDRAYRERRKVEALSLVGSGASPLMRMTDSGPMPLHDDQP